MLSKPSIYVPRVKLQMGELLKQLRKKNPDHPDIKQLEAAYEKVGKAGKEIDALVDKRECKLELIKLTKQISGLPADLNLLGKERQVVNQGTMLKQCRRAAKPFYFVLLSDMLIYGVGGESGGSISFHRVLHLSESMVKDIEESKAQAFTGHKYALEILNKKKSFVVYLKSKGQKRQWLPAMIKACEANRPLGSAPLKFAPTWLHDDAVKACQHCQTVWMIINRRHHCRNCGECVCGSCSPHREVLVHIHPTKKQRLCKLCKDNPDRKNAPGAGEGLESDESESDSDEEGASKQNATSSAGAR